MQDSRKETFREIDFTCHKRGAAEEVVHVVHFMTFHKNWSDRSPLAPRFLQA